MNGFVYKWNTALYVFVALSANLRAYACTPKPTYFHCSSLTIMSLIVVQTVQSYHCDTTAGEVTSPGRAVLRLCGSQSLYWCLTKTSHSAAPSDVSCGPNWGHDRASILAVGCLCVTAVQFSMFSIRYQTRQLCGLCTSNWQLLIERWWIKLRRFAVVCSESFNATEDSVIKHLNELRYLACTTAESILSTFGSIKPTIDARISLYRLCQLWKKLTWLVF